MMEIRKITAADINDPARLETLFSQVEAHPIACCNWEKEFPYRPHVTFKMFHNGSHLLIRFEVEEECTMARVTEDKGPVWTDSCVEFFVSVHPRSYYNFETSCNGCLLLAHHLSREEAEDAPQEVIDTVIRYPSYARKVRFDEIQGDNRWSMMLAIPATALFRHTFDDWSGLEIRANLYKCGDHLSRPHFLSWKPIPIEKPDFHRPDFFDNIKLSK